jgi:hypothetical protein
MSKPWVFLRLFSEKSRVLFDLKYDSSEAPVAKVQQAPQKP